MIIIQKPATIMKLAVKFSILVFNAALIAILLFSYFSMALPYAEMYQGFKLFSVGALLLSSAVIFYKRIRSCPFRKFEWTQTAVESKAGQKSYIYTNTEIFTFVSDVVFFGFVCRMYLDLIPLPPDTGFVVFALALGFAPVINLLALLCCRVQS
jgi:hypothetical protein